METIDLILSQAGGLESEAPLLLHSAAEPGICQAVYAPGSGQAPGEVVEETITLALNGTEAEVRKLLSQIVRCLERGAAESGTPGGLWCYLRAKATPSARRLRSKVLGGWLELPGGADLRARGGQRARLHLRRENYWEEEDLCDAALVGIPAAGSLEECAWRLETFSADFNDSPGIPAFVEGTQTLTLGELPAPAWLEVTDESASPVPFHLWAAESAADWGVETRCGVLWRGGVAGTIAQDPTCMEGSYINMSWNGAGEVDALEIDGALTGAEEGPNRRWRGQPCRVMLRLRSAINTASSEAMWSRWKLLMGDTAGESFVMELEPQQFPQGEQLIAGPVVSCPPWAPQDLTTFTIRLAVALQAAGSGAHALQVDSAWLAPLDGGWRFYRLAPTGSRSRMVRDDPYSGLLVDEDGTQGHAAEGPGLWLYPGRAQHFHFFFMQQSGAAPVGRSYALRLKYRPRWRTL